MEVHDCKNNDTFVADLVNQSVWKSPRAEAAGTCGDQGRCLGKLLNQIDGSGNLVPEFPAQSTTLAVVVSDGGLELVRRFRMKAVVHHLQRARSSLITLSPGINCTCPWSI